MKKINKKILVSIFIFFIILLLSVSIIIANNALNKTNFEIDKEKIYYEIKYFDARIVYMINLLNNIHGDNNFYINWGELQTQTQSIYTYWNSAILDLNYLDTDKSSLTNFSKNLDKLTIAIKNNDKESTLNTLVELYSKLNIYSEIIDDNYNNLLDIKYNLLCAYSVAEKENWTLTHEYILKSSESVSNLVNSMENNEFSQYNINQAYIAVKELENLIDIKDLDIFYFKYKIAIEKLNNL